MKRLLTGLIAAFFVSALVSPVGLAHGDSESSVSDDVTAESRAEDRQARIDAHKEAALEKISSAEERRVAAACKSSQVVIDKLGSSLNKVFENRHSVYEKLTDKLTVLFDKLQAASVDTTELNVSTTELSTLIEEVSAKSNDYITTVSDLAAMDCEADAAGFKAALDAARTQRAELVAKSTEVKTFLNENLKPLLASIRDSLNNDSQEE